MPPTEPTQPSLRADLIVTTQETSQQTTYTVRDEVTGESFRMYAVEYAIAQRLNGERTLQDIIKAVREDLQVEVALPELVNFLRELHQRGLVLGFVEPQEQPLPAAPSADAAGGRTPSSNEQLTATLSIDVPPREAPSPKSGKAQAPSPTLMEEAETVASPEDAVAAGAFALVTQELVLHERGSQALAKAGLAHDVDVDPEEVQRMLRDAISRMVGDDVRGAATILHAAQALAPQDERVHALVEATQTAYSRGTQEATNALKAQSASLFPELMPQPQGATTRPDSGLGAAPTKKRGARVAAACVLGVALMGGGLWLRAQHGKPVKVHVVTEAFTEHQERHEPAQEVRGAPIATLAFDIGGVVAQVPTPGAQVAAKELLASLKLPAAVRQNLLVSAQRLRQAEINIIRLQRHREEIVAARKALLAGKQRISPARKKSALRVLDKEERQVRAALLAAQNHRAQADQAQKARYESARTLQIFAPKAGLVEQVMVRVGDPVEAHVNVVRLADPEQLTVSFVRPRRAKGYEEGAKTPLLVGGGKQGRREVVGKVVPAPASAQVTGNLYVAVQGTGLPLTPGAYLLPAPNHPQALRVPKAAVVTLPGTPSGSFIWSVHEGRLCKREVELLDDDAAQSWVALKQPYSGANLTLVTEAPGASLAALHDGGATLSL